jgi:hypothetical protein
MFNGPSTHCSKPLAAATQAANAARFQRNSDYVMEKNTWTPQGSLLAGSFAPYRDLMEGYDDQASFTPINANRYAQVKKTWTAQRPYHL